MASIRRSVSRVSRVPKDRRRGAAMRKRRRNRPQPSLVDLLPNRLAEEASPGSIDEITQWFESAEAELVRKPVGMIQ